MSKKEKKLRRKTLMLILLEGLECFPFLPQKQTKVIIPRQSLKMSQGIKRFTSKTPKKREKSHITKTWSIKKDIHMEEILFLHFSH